jgi:Protein of unknown function (DUF1634).
VNVNSLTSAVLKIGLIAGLLITITGLLLQDHFGDTILWIGLLIMICSPLIGIFATVIMLIKEKDWKWVKIAIILIVVIMIGLILSLVKF